jgi:hypothetical protein
MPANDIEKLLLPEPVAISLISRTVPLRRAVRSVLTCEAAPSFSSSIVIV